MRGAGIVSIGGLVSDIELQTLGRSPMTRSPSRYGLQASAAGRNGPSGRVGCRHCAFRWRGCRGGGVVTAVGAAVDDWAPGDEVLTHPLPLRTGGTWAPQLIVPAALLARKPAAISRRPRPRSRPGADAEQALSEAVEINAGETLLFHGGGGVTGGLLVALAAVRRPPPDPTAYPPALQHPPPLPPPLPSLPPSPPPPPSSPPPPASVRLFGRPMTPSLARCCCQRLSGDRTQ